MKGILTKATQKTLNQKKKKKNGLSCEIFLFFPFFSLISRVNGNIQHQQAEGNECYIPQEYVPETRVNWTPLPHFLQKHNTVCHRSLCSPTVTSSWWLWNLFLWIPLSNFNTALSEWTKSQRNHRGKKEMALCVLMTEENGSRVIPISSSLGVKINFIHRVGRV